SSSLTTANSSLPSRVATLALVMFSAASCSLRAANDARLAPRMLIASRWVLREFFPNGTGCPPLDSSVLARGGDPPAPPAPGGKPFPPDPLGPPDPPCRPPAVAASRAGHLLELVQEPVHHPPLPRLVGERLAHHPARP